MDAKQEFEIFSNFTKFSQINNIVNMKSNLPATRETFNVNQVQF